MLLTVLGVILLIFALFLVVSVLMQHGRAKNISGAIAGGAETFFGKTKGSTIDKMLSKITTAVAIVFVLIVVIVYVMQDTAVEEYLSFDDALNATVTDTVDTSADTAADTSADTAADTASVTEAAE
ncbi:MAG: preprotein translocase subunit SecG [Clostridia bacterium]|nr:preprotein translocase subunit SecG [Clostridia bacterium]